LICVAISLLAPTPLRAQCSGLCGDVDQSGAAATTADFFILWGFLHHDSTIADLECADVDDYDLITLRDAGYLNSYQFAGGPAPICPPTNGKLVPTPTANFVIQFTGAFPANQTSASIFFKIQNLVPLRGVNLALQLRVGGAIPTIDTVETDVTAAEWWDAGASANPAGSPAGSVSAGFIQIGPPLAVGEHDLMRVDVTMPQAPCPRLVTVDWISLPPIMNDELGTPTPVNYLMILDQNNGAWAPVAPSCLVQNTGDLNLDLSRTTADIIIAVGYVLKGGCPFLPCEAAGDLNCDGSITTADIIYLVSDVFKSGPDPCDVGALVPGTRPCP